MTDWGEAVQIVQRGTNAARNPDLKKGHHRKTPDPIDHPVSWLLFCALARFLPRWQAARR